MRLYQGSCNLCEGEEFDGVLHGLLGFELGPSRFGIYRV